MKFAQLEIAGAWIVHSLKFFDNRGVFQEWFKSEDISAEMGFNFQVEQANISVSHKHALRGIHYSISKKGQAKWLTCVSGSIFDVIVDLRQDSPTFGKFATFELHAGTGTSIVIGPSLGHGFMALEENTSVVYLLSSPYSPEEEYAINPMDPQLAINWPATPSFISSKDLSAPKLQEQKAKGCLP